MSDEKRAEAEGESERSGILERIVKKGIESSIGAINKSEDRVRSFVDRTRLPKEVAHALLDQVDEAIDETRRVLEEARCRREMKEQQP